MHGLQCRNLGSCLCVSDSRKTMVPGGGLGWPSSSCWDVWNNLTPYIAHSRFVNNFVQPEDSRGSSLNFQLASLLVSGLHYSCRRCHLRRFLTACLTDLCRFRRAPLQPPSILVFPMKGDSQGWEASVFSCIKYIKIN